MKKLLTLIGIIIFSTAKANYQDTTINNNTINADTSIVIGNDTIYFNYGAILIAPVVVDAQGNKAFSITWSAFDVTQDTTKGCNTYVILRDKYNVQLATFNQPIPSSVVNVWFENTVIDNYILSQNPRFVKIAYFSKK